MNHFPGYVQSETDPKKRAKMKDILGRHASRHLTICEQLRFVYDDVMQLPDGTIKDSLTDKLIDTIIMAKKMNNRLVQYKKEAGKDSGSGGAHLINLEQTALRNQLRNQREATNL